MDVALMSATFTQEVAQILIFHELLMTTPTNSLQETIPCVNFYVANNIRYALHVYTLMPH